MAPDVTAGTEPARVLLVEDDAETAALVGRLLRRAWPQGLLITHTEGLGDATEALLDRGATVVVFDAAGGRADPLAAIARLHGAAPEVPIIALSDGEDEAFGVQAIAAGAQDHLNRSELTTDALSRAIRFSVLRKRSEANLAHRALHDALTGLPNRALFLDRLGVALDRSRRTGGTLAVLFMDVDEFKAINDTFGHAAGDRVLSALAGRLRALLRPTDTLSRFGGDEFTLLVEDLAGHREAAVLVERLRRAAQTPIEIEHASAGITVSIGLTMVDDPTLAPDVVIRRADAAMYDAKRHRRARIIRPRPELIARSPGATGVGSELQRALDRREIEVVYQPRFALDGQQTVTGFEALARWDHPTRGALAPAELAALADEAKAAVPLGVYVLACALRELAPWRPDRPELTIALNVSAGQLAEPDFARALADAARDTGIQPGLIYLEVPEAAFGARTALAAERLAPVREQGLSIAIDDFGMGPASTGLLERVAVDALVIDPRFVSVVGHGPATGSVAGAVIELAHEYGLSAIAEGVETDEQLSALRALGCDEAQGFLFGQPLAGGEMATVISSN